MIRPPVEAIPRYNSESGLPYLMGVVGPSGSGKTRLIQRLVPLLRRRGLRVGTIKHAHDRVDLDRPGKDSWRCLKAGAEVAAVVGPRQILVVRQRRRAVEDGLAQALACLSAELDLVLLEGFHTAKVPQIAVADRAGRIPKGRGVVAVVSDRPFDIQTAGRSVRSRVRRLRGRLRRFRTRQIRDLAAFIDQEWTKQWEAARYPASQALFSAEA